MYMTIKLTKLRMLISSHKVNVYKSVWPLVIKEQLVLEKVPAGQSTWWICSGSDKGFSDRRPHSLGKIIHRWYGILLYKGALSSVILPGEGGKKKD